MSDKILEKNSVEITNVEGARFNRFCAGNQDGIIKGAFQECQIAILSSNVIQVAKGEILISGYRVISDVKNFSFTTYPSEAIRYRIVARLQTDDNGQPSYSMIVQPVVTELVKQDICNEPVADRTYEVEIGRFSVTTTTITDSVRTLDVITGGGQSGADLEIGQVTTNIIDSNLDAEVDVDYKKTEDGKRKLDFKFQLPIDLTEIKKSVNNAETKAANAETKSQNAETAASAAQTAATNAETKAASAEIAATNAETASNEAKVVADGAVKKVDELETQITDKQGSLVKINGQVVPEINFSSDPQTQIDAKLKRITFADLEITDLPTTLVNVSNQIIAKDLRNSIFTYTNDNFNYFSDAPDAYGHIMIITGNNVLRPTIFFTKDVGDKPTHKTWIGYLVRSGSNVSEVTFKEIMTDDKASNPNLLSNSNLAFNPGPNEYTTAGLIVDDWVLGGSGSGNTLNYNASERKLTCGTKDTDGYYAYITQFLQKPYLYAGQTFTFSVSAESIEHSWLIQVWYNDTNISTKALASTQYTTSDGFKKLTFTIPETITTAGKIRLLIQTRGVLKIYWAKLEIGTVATEYSPDVIATDINLVSTYDKSINFYNDAGDRTGRIRSTYNKSFVHNADAFYFRKTNNQNNGVIVTPGVDVHPEQNKGANLGSSTNAWNNAYIDGSINTKSTMHSRHSIIKGTRPTSISYREVIFRDGAGSTATVDNFGAVGNSVDTNGNVSTFMRAYNNIAGNSTQGTIQVQAYENGTYKYQAGGKDIVTFSGSGTQYTKLSNGLIIQFISKFRVEANSYALVNLPTAFETTNYVVTATNTAGTGSAATWGGGNYITGDKKDKTTAAFKIRNPGSSYTNYDIIAIGY